jgi:saccharopine dehydrogenase-like NADP-dependent oxidoreductase
MRQVLVLGGYGAVGEHASRTLADAGVGVVVAGRRREPAQRLAYELGDAEALVVDGASPEAVRAAAERVDVVIDCSGRESVELVEAVLAGGAHLVDVSADYLYQRAVTERVGAAGAAAREVLFSVGPTPGLTNLLAAEVAAAAPDGPIELVAVLGAGEDHGRAARDWTYGLLGRHFADTSGAGGLVRNFTGRQSRQIPGIGPCWVYRVDVSDQHVLAADLGRPVTTRMGMDSRPMTGLMAVLGRVPGAAQVLRALEAAVPWSWLGSDRWVVAAGRPGRIERWATGRNEGYGTGVVAGLATLALLDAPSAGVTHLHQRTSLDALAPQLERYGIEVGAVNLPRRRMESSLA